MSDFRAAPYRSYITSAVYGRLSKESKFSNVDMWKARSITVKGKAMTVYRSRFWWKVA